MDVAVKSYLTAGVAAVGATALVLAPVHAMPNDLEIRAERAVASITQEVDLAAFTPAGFLAAAQDVFDGFVTAGVLTAAAANTAIGQLGDAIQASLTTGITNGTFALAAVGQGFLDAAGQIIAPGTLVGLRALTATGFLAAAQDVFDGFVTAGLLTALAANTAIIQIGNAIQVSLTTGITNGTLALGAIGQGFLDAFESLITPTPAAAVAVQALNPAGFLAAAQDVFDGFVTAGLLTALAANTAITQIGNAIQASLTTGITNGTLALGAIGQGFLDAFESLITPTPAAAVAVQALNPAGFLAAAQDVFDGFVTAGLLTTAAANTAITQIGNAIQASLTTGITNGTLALAAIGQGFLDAFGSLTAPTPAAAVAVQALNPAGFLAAAQDVFDGFVTAGLLTAATANTAITRIGDAIQVSLTTGITNGTLALGAIGQGFLDGFESLTTPAPVVTVTNDAADVSIASRSTNLVSIAAGDGGTNAPATTGAPNVAVTAETTGTTGPAQPTQPTAAAAADEDTEAAEPVSARSAAKAERDAAQAARKAERDAAKAERSAARAEAKADRAAAKTEAKAERDAAKAERKAERDAAKADRGTQKADDTADNDE